MNKKAQELGLNNTHFVTPHGLDNNEHYTTAYELALLADYALQNNTFAKIVNTKTYTISINGNPKTINNTNELLGYLNGVNGVKTGFTNNAGRCLVTSTTRNNWQIISVVLGADTKKFRTKDSISLIEYTFNNYELIDIKKIIEDEFQKWQSNNESKIEIEKGIKNKVELELSKITYNLYPIKKDEIKNIECTVDVVNYVKAPISKNSVLGSVQLKLGEKTICNIDILCKEDVKKRSVSFYLVHLLNNFGNYLSMNI